MNWNLYQAESSDLVSYGLIPEFVGRFPILVSLAALTEDQLVQVYIVEMLCLINSIYVFFSLMILRFWLNHEFLLFNDSMFLIESWSDLKLFTILDFNPFPLFAFKPAWWKWSNWCTWSKYACKKFSHCL